MALICFVLIVATTLIYGIIARTPDTHSNLWNEVRDGYTRTEVSWVESEPGPLMASLPLVASSSVSSLPAGGAPGAAPASAPALPAAVAPQDPSFSKDVLPIFKANCFACHSGAVALGGVSLVSYQSLTDTKAHKQLLVPGKPQDSLLMNLLRKTAGVQMPPLSPLEPDKIQTIENWIKQGGKDN
ncbi:MAG: hypothetical protein HYY32_06290 [Chloroflexi bacterium]|nr:hypothetical protein [Chloroflexota bacterium]